MAICMMVQLRKECELMQQRAEAAEGVLERERGVHRRELRRRAKEVADMQDDLVQVTSLCSLWLHAHCCNGRHLSTIADLSALSYCLCSVSAWCAWSDRATAGHVYQQCHDQAGNITDAAFDLLSMMLCCSSLHPEVHNSRQTLHLKMTWRWSALQERRSKVKP